MRNHSHNHGNVIHEQLLWFCVTSSQYIVIRPSMAHRSLLGLVSLSCAQVTPSSRLQGIGEIGSTVVCSSLVRFLSFYLKFKRNIYLLFIWLEI